MKILLCAGEASGDMYAARLIDELRSRTDEEIEFRGTGGAETAARGAELAYRVEDMAVMGFWPVLKKLPFFMRAMRDMKRMVSEWRPDAVVTVDYPGFNLRLARFAHSAGVPAVHIVCPQVWAWHRGRIPGIAASLDRLLCFFPFEPALFPDMPGFKATFIGHPLADVFRREDEAGAPGYRWEEGVRRVALLPGSRRGEIERCLPRLLKAAREVESELSPQPVQFAIPAASARARAAIDGAIAANAGDAPSRLAVEDGGARAILRTAEAAAVASGTATLEAALARCPSVLVYAVSAPLALFARLVIKGVRHVGLANIVAGREVMPELLQGAFTPARTAGFLAGWLRNEASRAEAAAALDSAVRPLETGEAGALGRAAEEILYEIAVRRSLSGGGGAA